MILFEESFVTAASKHEQSLEEAPSAVTVITAEDIRRFGYRTLAEALRSVPGFYTSYDRNYAYLGVRGFLRPGDYNNRILLLVNGHTYNDDIYGSAAIDNSFGIDMEAIRRIEIVRGPGSALYGGNALFAVINVVTAGATDLPGMQPLVEGGSYGHVRGQSTYGHVFDSGLSLFASGSAMLENGPSTLFYPAYDSPDTNNGVAVHADGERAVNAFLSARYGGFFFQAAVNQREKDIPTGSFGTTFNDPDNHTVDSRPFAELSYTAEVLPTLLAYGRVYYDGVFYRGTYVYGTGDQRDLFDDRGTSNWFGGEARLEWRPLPQHTITVGTEYSYHPDARQTYTSTRTRERFVDTSLSYGTLGVYAQDEWHVLPQLTLVGGLRYDHYYNGIDQVSPRAALLWQPWSRTHLKLLYGQAFRAPNLYELYYSSVDSPFDYRPNPALSPESITTYEAVLEQDLPYRARAQLSVYHYELDGLIDLATFVDPNTGNPYVQFENLNGARASGAELALSVPITDKVLARVGYSLQHARADNGAQLSNSPQNLGVVALLFPLPYGVQGGAEIQVESPRLTLARTQLPTAVVGNLTLDYATPIHGLATSVGLYNIFNQKYSDPAAPEHLQDAIPQNGFTFRVQLRYQF